MFKPTTDYFFNIQPEPFASWGVFFVTTAILAMIGAAAALAFRSKIPMFFRKMARKTRGTLFWYAVISLLLYFFRMEQIPYLSMRVWLWLWFFGFWTIVLVVLYKEYRKIPERKEKWAQELQLKRYAL